MHNKQNDARVRIYARLPHDRVCLNNLLPISRVFTRDFQFVPIETRLLERHRTSYTVHCHNTVIVYPTLINYT